MNDRNARNDGDLTMLFGPDELAVYEYRKTSERKTFFEPEKRLAFAVLEDAVLCFKRFVKATSRKEKQLYQDAAAWIFEPDENGIFSFEFICEVCGFDPDFFRMGLKKWREESSSSGVSPKVVGQLLKLHGYRRRNRASVRAAGAAFRGSIMTPIKREPL